MLELDVYACSNEMSRLFMEHMDNKNGLNAIRNKYSHCRMATMHPLLNLSVNYPSFVMMRE